MKFVLLTIGFLTLWRADADCPFSAKIYPCTCTPYGIEGADVECANIDSIWDLVVATKGLRPGAGFYGTQIGLMTLKRITMVYLPHDLFNGLFIRKMILKKDIFVSLSDSAVAFKGLEDSLESVTIEDCEFMNSWNWNKLRNLKKLQKLHVMSGDLVSVGEDIKNLSHLPISDVALNRNFISWIHDEAFASFQSLRSLSLHHNDIENVRRTMLPNPAKSLVFLDLSYNKIQTLPDNIFSGMPHLTDVSLAQNQLLTFQQAVFEPVWKQFKEFSAVGNPTSCDCRITWVTNMKFNSTTHKTLCQHPERLKGRSLDELRKSDLWC